MKIVYFKKTVPKRTSFTHINYTFKETHTRYSKWLVWLIHSDISETVLIE